MKYSTYGSKIKCFVFSRFQKGLSLTQSCDKCAMKQQHFCPFEMSRQSHYQEHFQHKCRYIDMSTEPVTNPDSSDSLCS